VAAAPPDISPAEVEALARSLVHDDAIFFPVRHHSPACAWHLQRIVRERRPSAILVEGPSSFDALIPLIVHEQAQAPLAIYSYCVLRTEAPAEGAAPEAGRFASYYPLCDYSPEMVALREGARLQAKLRFIDLDYGAQCALEAPEDELESLLDERRWRDSRYLRALARRCGCRDHDELWDHLFENGHRDVPTHEFIGRLAAYCLLVRRETPEAAMQRDGTLAREAEMAWHVREALAARAPGDGPVLVVTGGFHTVVLADRTGAAVARPTTPAGKTLEQQAALIRYSFERLDRLNGYSAGMPSPAWYQALWQEKLTRDAAIGMLFDVAERLRRESERPGTTLLVAALEQAERLALLRGRSQITRSEVLDAILSCFVKGAADAEGVQVLTTAMKVLAGKAVGVLPPGTGVPPLVRDFTRRAKRHRLKIDDSEPRKLTLDLYRRPEHRQTSRMLHGLVLLVVPLANRVAGPDFVRGTGLERLHEHWEYTFTPAAEAALVEASVHGSTLPEAVANKFAAGLAKLQDEGGSRSARVAVGKLGEALVLGLHDHLPRLTAWLRETLAEDPEFASMAFAATQLDLLRQSREPLEAPPGEELPLLMRTAYERACFLMADMAAVPEGGEQEAATALIRLREMISTADRNALDASLFWDTLVRVVDEPACRPLVAGVASGLLSVTGRMDEAELVRRIRGRFAGAAQPRDAVAYLGGVFLAARETAWQVPAVLATIDERLAAWSNDEFIRTLPDLRLMFAAMTPHESDRIADAISGLHGGRKVERIVSSDISAARAQANLAIDEMARAALARDGLAHWIGAGE
jgi:hypothetical protein